MGGNNQVDIGVAMVPLVVLKSGEPVGWQFSSLFTMVFVHPFVGEPDFRTIKSRMGFCCLHFLSVCELGDLR